LVPREAHGLTLRLQFGASDVPKFRSGKMHNLDDVTRLPDDFDGRVRLFPLPELVVFPHAMQPLHIFEPRYCELLSDALGSDHLIAMATLTGGIATTAEHAPPIATTVCLAKIISHAEVEHDRHNILLVGIRRAKIIREIDTGRSFRIAEIDVAEDIYPPVGAESRVELKQRLLDAFGEIIPVSSNVQKNLHELMAGQMGLGPITDIVSYTLPFEAEEKLRLLAEPDVDVRAEELIGMLKTGKIELHSVSAEEQSIDQTTNEKFPPPFSAN
jgi:Lon protease-like protein